MRELQDIETPGSGANGSQPPLPEARRERWQPIRGGILNLYRYDHQEFHYEDGHILLRGNNGTGKSRVLALQLPFLLDGETAPHRLEPDGDPAKRVEWNLLMGKHSDRSGYTWIEFGRLDEQSDGNEDATARYVTLGCGLSAAQGRGLTGRWFFITTQRMGRDLFLQGETGHVLSRQRLAEQIGASGQVFTTARAYRQAVDQALYKLGEQRYEALIGLLIQLRQPQLSRNLDEARLSEALSEALQPLSQAVIDDVADSFRGLETDRQELESFLAARKGVEAFLGEYGRYSGIVVRRRAAVVRSAHSSYEEAMRRLRAAEAGLREIEVRLHQLKKQLEELSLEERAAVERVRTLEQSPEMRAAAALDEARSLAAERETEARGRESEHRDAVQSLAAREGEHLAVSTELEEAGKRAEQSAAAARERAQRIGLEGQHRAAADRLDDSGLPGLVRAEESLAAAVESRLKAARHLSALCSRVDEARNALARAREAQDDLVTQQDLAVEKHHEAQAALTAAREELLEAYREWQATCAEIETPASEDLEEALEDWCEDPRGEGPLRLAVRTAVQVTATRLASIRSDCEQRLRVAREALFQLEEERERLKAGKHTPPQAPHTRAPGARDARPGAPFWSLCDFAPGFVDPGEQAGLEAALEAAGLLDAWVTPDGSLLDPREHDVVLAAGRSPLPPEGRGLDAVLTAASLDPGESAVPEGVIRAVLSHLGLGPGAGAAWVATDGRWQLGPLQGAWSKPAAQHVGRGAREAERRRRLEALEREIDATEAVLAALREEMAALESREKRARREAEDAPGEEEVRGTLARIEQCAQAVEEYRRRVEEAEGRTALRRGQLGQAIEERDSAARDLDLSAWADDGPGLERAIQDYRLALADLWPWLRARAGLARRAADAGRLADEARREERRRTEALRTAREKAGESKARLTVLEESVGAAAADVLSRLGAGRTEVERLRGAREKTGEDEKATAIEAARKEKDIEHEKENLERETGERDAAMGSLRRLIETKLLPIAVRDFESVDASSWSVTRAVEVARALEARLADLPSDDAAWERSQRGIHRHVQELSDALLPHGYRPEATQEDGLFVVTCPFQGRECNMVELRDAIEQEVSSRQQLLDAREREVIENHLIGEVATHLHDRIQQAEELVREMNRELDARPTSTGMRLRFIWEPAEDGPAGLPEARRRLLGAGATWSPSERSALAEFLQQQIQSVRAANETGTWQEHLKKALDYRSWHRFAVERQQDGHWKRLTRRTHGTGSGGEKSIALTIPQFAASAAHYRTADPRAPRLILLDEAFVGVDADMRAKCMGLLHAFDLDFMMTSEREWGCYATLPGVAIYHLSARPGIDAVGVTRWVWNGRERVRAEARFPPAWAPGGGEDGLRQAGESAERVEQEEGADDLQRAPARFRPDLPFPEEPSRGPLNGPAS